jgi:outer membrane protein OmpA-like peptidoglycan-associated protein
MIRTDTIKKAIVTTIDTPTSTISQTPSKPNTSLSATISASGLYPDGKESVTINIEVEEFSSVLMTPLLPYIFFNEGESNLDSRYRSLNHTQTERFREEYVNSPDKLPTYYHLLNIVGKRLRVNPYATITLIGCNADIGIEKGNTKLSQMRAETIKNYLIQAWGIPETRITIQSRNLPLQHANTLTKDGAQENRRVEIISNDPSITAPLITRDTLRTVTPPSVRFRPKTFGESQIEQWKLEARQNSRLLKVFNGTGAIPGILDWNIDEERGTHPTTEAPVVYKLTVIDEKGAKVETGSEIEVEQLTIHKKRIERIADKEIDRFGLILFDVRSSEINSDNARIINLIKSYIKPTSTVFVKGLTDRLGNAAQNQSLAEERAKSTAKALGISTNEQNVRGVGNANLYAPELPEGRLYTRTVEIIVETPIIE